MYMQFTQIQQLVFIFLLLATTIVFLWMLGSFLFPIFWAMVIALVFYPLYEKLETRWEGRKNLASISTVGIIILLVVIPFFLVGGMVVKESFSLFQSLQTAPKSGEEPVFLQYASTMSAYLEPFNIDPETTQNWLRENVANLAETAGTSILSYGQSTIHFLAKLAIMVYLLFFFFKYGRPLCDKFTYYLPLKTSHETRLIQRFTDTTRAIVQGTLTIALLQGLLGGLILWMVGISAPVLWGVLMAILAIIPALGASLILMPAGFFLIITGSVWQGVAVMTVGILLVGLVDEFLRPLLVGRRAKIPDAVVLLATTGGIASFGITGFVIGPVIAAFCLSLWNIFGEEYREYLLDEVAINTNNGV